MEDKDLFNKWVYLTPHIEHWLKESNSNFNVPMTNRLARIIKVFNWDTKEGKLLLDAREKTGKWKNLVSKDFKFVLKIYYPDIILKEKKGLAVEEVIPRFYPNTKLEMFCEVPEWIINDIKNNKKIKEFSLIKNSKSKK